MLNLRRLRPQFIRDLVFYFGIITHVITRGIRADVVHVHGDWSAFLLGRIVGYLTGARMLAASLHDVARRGNGWRHVYRAALHNYGLTYATGAADAEYLKSCGAVAVYWQNSGVDAGFFNDVPEVKGKIAIDVVAVANFFPKKNIDLVIEIARVMLEATFLLIGDGPQRSAIEAACRTYGLNNVQLTGRLPSSEVSRRLRQARIFLSTSFREGTPTALLEAMASGLAVVTSRSNDYEELIQPGCNGYVIDTFQATDYVMRLRELLGDEDMLRNISLRNYEAAQQHSWPEVARRITNLMRAT